MVQTHSGNVVAMLKDKAVISWQAKHKVGRMRKIMSLLDHCEVKHIYREANRLANALATDIPIAAY